MTPSTSGATATAPRRALDEVALLRRLRGQAIGADSPLPRILYSWTTAEQIAAMRGDQVLLRRSQTADGRLSAFDQRLRALGDRAPAPLRRLTGEGCERRRFAWVNPWATVRGWEGEGYGDQLLEIVLRDDAILAIFAGDADVRYVDLYGRPLTEAEASAAASRLAGALHLVPPTSEDVGTMVRWGWPYREIVICDPAMVERWSYGTPALRGRLADDAGLLRALQAEFEATPPRRAELWRESTRIYNERWLGKGAPTGLRELYEGCLAWANERYDADAAVLGAVIDALEAARSAQGAPIEVTSAAGRP